MMTCLPTKFISQSWEDSNISSQIQVVISPAIGCLLKEVGLIKYKAGKREGKDKKHKWKNVAVVEINMLPGTSFRWKVIFLSGAAGERAELCSTVHAGTNNN